MPIPEEQLKTWSNPGGTQNSISAHTSIRNALEAADSPIRDKQPEIFLQGSYRNSTNIRADSDVDVVVQLNAPYYRDMSRLIPEQSAAFERTWLPSAYGAIDWRRDVEQALRKKFGSALKPGSGKAFHVVTGPGNMTADVLPAMLMKRYSLYLRIGVETYDEGVTFADAAGNLTTNYPKQHIKNGEDKNSPARTNGWYKPSVRMFKNARNRLISDGKLADDVAPSYDVECLIYNAPDSCFGGNYGDTFCAVVNHLWQKLFSTFTSQNGIIPLFGTLPTQWNSDKATAFMKALREMWLSGR
jgi:hypothetical protein